MKKRNKLSICCGKIMKYVLHHLFISLTYNSMSSHKEIIMCWIPSHIGVSRNEEAESAAKSALDLSPNNISILYTDLKPQIKFFLIKWQQCWNNNINNKLFQINPTLGEWRPAFRKSKKGTSHYISIVDWPHKSHSYKTQAGTATTMFDMPDTLHH